MNTLQTITKKIDLMTSELLELQDLKKLHLKYLTTNNSGAIATEEREPRTQKKTGSFNKPSGKYLGMTIKKAAVQCVLEANMALNTATIAELVFDEPQTNTKKFKRMYYSIWNSLYQQSAIIHKRADEKWELKRRD